MHETVIAQKILEEADKFGMVKKIRLEVGELGPLPPEELLATLQTMTKAIVDMKIIPAKIECDCSFKGHPAILERGHDYILYECPGCGEAPPLLEGKDIHIVSVDIVDNEINVTEKEKREAIVPESEPKK
jgi:Zn finger protein HypA/HybF involved in hydrogenase expression